MSMKNFFTSLSLSVFASFIMLVNIVKAENGQMMYAAILSGSDVVPPVLTDGQGLVTFLLSEDRQDVFIHGAFTNLSSPITACHLHLGTADTSGPVIIDLTPMVTGNRISGAVPVPAFILFQLAISGDVYVDVETEFYPDGEIRGELVWMAEIILPVIADAANEIPPVNLNASGLGALRISQNFSVLEYQLQPIGLSGPAIAAHIHSGDETMNGPVIATLNTGDFITGVITDPDKILEILLEAFTGGAYINVHTAANPTGEIRGQLLLDFPHNATGILNGDQETPPVSTTAIGYGYASLDFPNLDSITYAVIYSGIVPTTAHIHNARPGTAGPVVIPLRAGQPGFYFGRAAMSENMLTAFFKDELYFNIHSAAHPAGEIRGQIQNNLLKSFAFDVCGNQEVPKKSVDGYGASFVSVNKANTEVIYGLLVNDLTGPATAAHIHDGAFGANGSVILPLATPNPLAVEALPITGVQARRIDLDGAYVNVHTADNPTGEIRGQIRRSLSCDVVSTKESTIQDISLVNNPVKDQLRIKATADKSNNAIFYITDLSGHHLKFWKTNSLIAGLNTISLSVEDLPDGFYFLNLLDENHTVRSFKFVKH